MFHTIRPSILERRQPMLDRALADERVDALIVPIGKGELVCHKIRAGHE